MFLSVSFHSSVSSLFFFSILSREIWAFQTHVVCTDTDSERKKKKKYKSQNGHHTVQEERTKWVLPCQAICNVQKVHLLSISVHTKLHIITPKLSHPLAPLLYIHIRMYIIVTIRASWSEWLQVRCRFGHPFPKQRQNNQCSLVFPLHGNNENNFI